MEEMTDYQFKRFEELMNENSELKAKVKELEEKLKTLENTED